MAERMPRPSAAGAPRAPTGTASPLPVLNAEDLSKSFGAVQATIDVSLDLLPGEVHALIGPNGAGKTTFLGQLTGQLRPDRGRVRLEGRDVTRLGLPQRAELGIARSFQIPKLCSDFTALENAQVAIQAAAGHHFRFFRRADRDPVLRDGAHAVLYRVGLLDHAHVRAAELAHGQRRQLELALALATEPKALLLDEPMAGLGPAETEAMTELVRGLRGGPAILLVEHDMDVVFALADRISVLVYGRLLTTGTPEAIRADERVQAAYLREDD